MTIKRSTIALAVLFGGLADVIVTLIGQIGYDVIRENDPFSAFLLSIHPLVFFAVLSAFYSACAIIVYKAHPWISLPLAFVMIESDIIALMSWAIVFGITWEIMSTMIYFVPIVSLLGFAAWKLLGKIRA